MKIRLLTPQRVVAPVGTEIDIDDGSAALLIEIGAAEKVETVKAETQKKAEEPPKKRTKKAAE